jgi:hypothetical protein
VKLAQTFAVVLLLGGTLSAQQKPNFSGNWSINIVKSDFGAVPAPDVFTRKIVHAEPAITIDEEQSSPLGVQATSRKMVTTGAETTFTASGADVRATAKWEGTALVVVTTVDVASLTYNDRMTLSEDGKTLTSQVRLESPQGAVDLKVVFDKK